MARDRFGPYIIHWDRNTETLTITGDENTRASIHPGTDKSVCGCIQYDGSVVITISQSDDTK